MSNTQQEPRWWERLPVKIGAAVFILFSVILLISIFLNGGKNTAESESFVRLVFFSAALAITIIGLLLAAVRMEQQGQQIEQQGKQIKLQAQQRNNDTFGRAIGLLNETGSYTSQATGMRLLARLVKDNANDIPLVKSVLRVLQDYLEGYHLEQEKLRKEIQTKQQEQIKIRQEFEKSREEIQTQLEDLEKLRKEIQTKREEQKALAKNMERSCVIALHIIRDIVKKGPLNFSPEDRRKELFYKNFKEKNLSYLDFMQRIPDLELPFTEGEHPKIFFRNANFFFAKLEGVNLHKADLQGADLRYAKLEKYEISPQILNLKKPKILRGFGDVWNIYSKGVNLIEANLRGAKLQRAQLQGAQLKGAILQDAELQEAHLDGADLRAHSAANFGDARMERQVLQILQEENLELKDTNLKGAQLQMARLRGALFYFTDREMMKDANVEDADFWEAVCYERPRDALLKSEEKLIDQNWLKDQGAEADDWNNVWADDNPPPDAKNSTPPLILILIYEFAFGNPWHHGA